MVDPSADRAMYRQIADKIRAAIETGELQPDEALPSERQLAQTLGVSQIPTVRAAYRLLVAEGLIVSRQGHLPRVRARTELSALLDELRASVQALAAEPTVEVLDDIARIVGELRRLIEEDPGAVTE